jgi:hypothetical protein
MTQVFHRSLLSFTPLWEKSIDQTVTGNNRMTHDQWILFINSLVGETLTVKDVLVQYRQHGMNAIGYSPDREARTNVLGTLSVNARRWMGKSKDYQAKRAYLIAFMERMAAGAASRAAIIESIQRDPPKGKSSLLDQELEYYTNYEKYQRQRLSVYTVPEKLKALRTILLLYLAETSASYRRFGSRGVKDSVLDLLYGAMS